MLQVVGIIPARLQSGRLPRKLLLAETGKPLLQYAWEAARHAESLREVVIATDSDEIARVARGFGAECVMTGECASGTDRVASAVRGRFQHFPLVVNVQGDEPELDPSHIDAAVCALNCDPGADMATLCSPIADERVLRDPAAVKLVRAGNGRALYFSRAAVPYERHMIPGACRYLHVGVYAYRRECLLRLAALPVSTLEAMEGLEQLRALEAGMRIQTACVPHAAPGIDTPADYERFADRHRSLR